MPVNFLDLQRKDNNFRKGLHLDPFDEPTYLTFSLDFNFDTVPDIEGQTDMINKSPLFAENTQDGAYGCIDYLTNRGYPDKSANMKKFKNLLQYVTNETPWYFQSVKGLDKMWEQATDMNFGYKANEIELEIDTLEAIDLRISNLAQLYRNSVYDMKYMRERVPDNMRWFTMDIWIAEFRNLRNTLPPLVSVGNFTSVNLGSIGGLLGASSGDENSSTGNVLANFGYQKFKCRQCEFDFSPSFAAGPDVGVGADAFSGGPNTNKFKIKIGFFEEESSFASGDSLTDDLSKRGGGLFGSLANLPIVGDKLSSLSSKATQGIQDIMNTPNKLIGQATKELQSLVEGGSFGQVNPFGYTSNGDTIPTHTAVPKNQNGKSL